MMSFQYDLSLTEAGSEPVELVLVVTDNDGNETVSTYYVTHDETAPVLSITTPGIALSPP